MKVPYDKTKVAPDIRMGPIWNVRGVNVTAAVDLRYVFEDVPNIKALLIRYVYETIKNLIDERLDETDAQRMAEESVEKFIEAIGGEPPETQGGVDEDVHGSQILSAG